MSGSDGQLAMADTEQQQPLIEAYVALDAVFAAGFEVTPLMDARMNRVLDALQANLGFQPETTAGLIDLTQENEKAVLLKAADTLEAAFPSLGSPKDAVRQDALIVAGYFHRRCTTQVLTVSDAFSR